jgi:hypothetical protein
MASPYQKFKMRRIPRTRREVLNMFMVPVLLLLIVVSIAAPMGLWIRITLIISWVFLAAFLFFNREKGAP